MYLPGSARYLLMVARDQPALFDYLRQAFSGDKEVRAFFDRRRRKRRQRVQAHKPERRWADRRGRLLNVDDLRSRGFVILRPSRKRPRDASRP